jgi:hypothetical protein
MTLIGLRAVAPPALTRCEIHTVVSASTPGDSLVNTRDPLVSLPASPGTFPEGAVQRSSADGHAIPEAHPMPPSCFPLAFRFRALYNETETSQTPP